MQIFVRTIHDGSRTIDVTANDTVATLKQRIEDQVQIPSTCQGLVYSGRQLQDDCTLDQYSIEAGSTIHLVLRLCGGKGGFGALLRGQGRDGKITTNFDACRDLQGRRVRHATAEQKLTEWNAQAKERELEKIALKHIKESAKQKQREERAKVDVEEVQEAQKEAVAKVQDAVQEALASAATSAQHASLAKRKAQAQTTGPTKKPKMLACLDDFGSDLSSSDEDDEGKD